MLKSILAIISAAVCAAVIIAFVPELEPAAAAGTPQSDQRGMQTTTNGTGAAVIAASHVADAVGATCTQAWPYYERSCLHDSRRPNSAVRAARVIAADHPAQSRAAKSGALAVGGSR
jgi:hypothetical protein